MKKNVAVIGSCVIYMLCVFCLFILSGCADKQEWGSITDVRIEDKIQPYEEQDPNATMGIGTNELREILPIADDMGAEALYAGAFAIRGESVFDDSRCSYAAEACRKAVDYQDPEFVIISINPREKTTKWPMKYVLELTDLQKNMNSYIAIQPIAELSTDYTCDKVGFCTRLEGPESFSLLFIVPGNVVRETTRITLKSDHGAIGWPKKSGNTDRLKLRNWLNKRRFLGKIVSMFKKNKTYDIKIKSETYDKSILESIPEAIPETHSESYSEPTPEPSIESSPKSHSKSYFQSIDLSEYTVRIIYAESRYKDAQEISNRLKKHGANTYFFETGSTGNSSHAGKIYYSYSSQLGAVRKIQQLVEDIETVTPDTKDSASETPQEFYLWVVK